jgi:hypothetical protein
MDALRLVIYLLFSSFLLVKAVFVFLFFLQPVFPLAFSLGIHSPSIPFLPWLFQEELIVSASKTMVVVVVVWYGVIRRWEILLLLLLTYWPSSVSYFSGKPLEASKRGSHPAESRIMIVWSWDPSVGYFRRYDHEFIFVLCSTSPQLRVKGRSNSDQTLR